jgi:hypothetical protein
MALFPGGGIRPRVNTTSSPAAPQVGNGTVLTSDDGLLRDGVAAIPNGANGIANGNSNGHSNGANGNASDGATNAEGTSGDYKAREMVMEIDTDDEDFDDEMLRMSHKVHTVLVDELGGQQFKPTTANACAPSRSR